jgi:hypothetical protein
VLPKKPETSKLEEQPQPPKKVDYLTEMRRARQEEEKLGKKTKLRNASVDTLANSDIKKMEEVRKKAERLLLYNDSINK